MPGVTASSGRPASTDVARIFASAAPYSSGSIFVGSQPSPLRPVIPSIRGLWAAIQIGGPPGVYGVSPSTRVLEVVELALEVDGALGAPQQAHHVERLVEVADRLVPLHPVRLDVQLLAAAEPEDRATLRDVVERERLSGRAPPGGA